MFTSNVGDSRAVLGQRVSNGKVLAVDLSSDHTPMRRDETTRVEKSGGRILTWDQIDGHRDQNIRIWEQPGFNHGDPPRVWFPKERFPGTAFTRLVAVWSEQQCHPKV